MDATLMLDIIIEETDVFIILHMFINTETFVPNQTISLGRIYDYFSRHFQPGTFFFMLQKVNCFLIDAPAQWSISIRC